MFRDAKLEEGWCCPMEPVNEEAKDLVEAWHGLVSKRKYEEWKASLEKHGCETAEKVEYYKGISLSL